MSGFGERLRIGRGKRNLSQRELAARTGVAQNTISRLERGLDKPQPKTVEALAKGLKVSPSVLLADAETGTEHVRRLADRFADELVSLALMGPESRERAGPLLAALGRLQGVIERSRGKDRADRERELASVLELMRMATDVADKGLSERALRAAEELERAAELALQRGAPRHGGRRPA